MFEKLLAILPYNPSLVHQMKFYGSRMHEEAVIRRIGLVFLVLTFMVQFFAVLSPPQPTVADAPNDLITGGFSSATEAKQKCQDNVRHYGDIMNHYGIACADIGNADTVDLHSNSANYYSLGHSSQGPTNQHSHKATHEEAVNIPEANTEVYARLLSSSDTHDHSDYKALRVKSSTSGRTFYVLKNCGDLVSVDVPVPPTAPKSPQPQDVCPDKAGSQSSKSQCARTCQYNPSLSADDAACKPCDKSINSEDTVGCVLIHKSAANITAGVPNADATTANAGDVITYTLYAQNSGKAAVGQFIFQEALSDVLDYADITDLHGGKIDDVEKVASWPAQSIAPGQTVSEQVTVKVKNPIPQTPASTTDPNHFDLIMTNVYGNAVNIKVPGGPAKAVETTAATLPNTGPGTGLFIATGIVILASYFYSRARLLARESELAVKEVNYA